MGVGTLRRHYRNKVLAREMTGEDATAMVYQAKADAIAGHALPVKFVTARLRAALIAKGITTLDDLNGASAAEIAERTGLAKTDAGKVRVAVEREVALRAEDREQILADFPHQAVLTTAGYTTRDSIEDLDEAELTEIPGLGEAGARLVRAELDGLLGVPFNENYPHLIRLGELGIRAVEQLAQYSAEDLVRFGMTEEEAAEVIAFRDALAAPEVQTLTADAPAPDDQPPPLESDAVLPESQQQPAAPTPDPTATAGTEGETASQVTT